MQVRTYIWIAILIAIGFLLVWLWRRPSIEGFWAQLTLNMDYKPKEIFLVGDFLNINDIYRSSQSAVPYERGYTYEEAVAVCQKYGGRLADTSSTPLNLNTAVQLGGQWCAAGWANDGSAKKAYYINGTAGQCDGSTSTGLREYDPYSQPGTRREKAFAICIAPKPEEFTTIDVQAFARDQYSMFKSDVMAYVMSGQRDLTRAEIDGNTSLFTVPRNFSPSQAYYALEQNNYNMTQARQSLITELGNAEATPTADDTYTKNIATAIDPNSVESTADKTAWNTNTATKACESIARVRGDMYTKLTTLNQLFSDLSGNTEKAGIIKSGQGNLQSMVADICRRDPDSSSKSTAQTDACRRLLTLDYDVFYKNRSSDPLSKKYVISDLESLNFALQMRECEIQEDLGSLEALSEILTCPASGQPAIPPALKFSTNRDPNKRNQPFNCSYKPEDVPKDTAFKVQKSIPFNRVEQLKKRFEEISPYYSAAEFKDLANTVLDRLSVILNTPDNTEFMQFNDIFGTVRKNLDKITVETRKILEGT